MRARTLFAQADAGYKEGCEYLLKARDAGATQREIAKVIRRSQTWVNRVLRWHSEGCNDAGPFALDHERARDGAATCRDWISTPYAFLRVTVMLAPLISWTGPSKHTNV